MALTRADAYRLFHDGILAFSRAEQCGIRIDLVYCGRKYKQLGHKIELLEEDFRQTKFYQHWQHVYGLKTNIHANAQLAHLLYDVRKIEPINFTTSGKGSVDEETLVQLDIPELAGLIQIRQFGKLKDTYLESLMREQVEGYVHSFFNLHTAKSYRSSSDRPNYHNFPARDEAAMRIIRDAIFPRPGHQIGQADYGSIEVRGACCYCQDPNLRKYIEDPTTDMHGDMAKQIFKVKDFNKKTPEHYVLRQASKNGFVFPEFYGDYFIHCAENMACGWCKLPKGKWKSGQGISMPQGTISDHLMKQTIEVERTTSSGRRIKEEIPIDSYEVFEEHVRQVEDDFWNRRFKVYQAWKDRWWSQYQKKGYFDLLTGFRCSGVMRKNEVINLPVQGAAFHCLLWAFIRLDAIQTEEKWRSRLVGQIHDSIVLDIHPDERDHVLKTVRRVMCKDLRKAWSWITVPLDVEIELCDVDRPWSEKKAYKVVA
jgi:DNA polymerase-1